MLELIEKGRFLIWPLMALSVVTMCIFFERFFYYHRVSINVGEFLKGLTNLIKNKNFAEALYECTGTPGPVARVIHSTLIRHNLPRQELKEVAQEAGQLEMPRVERYLGMLAAIVYLSPLLGLLGTVIGLIDTFVEVNATSGFASPARLSEGVYQSLISSAVGLTVAIPTFICYSYLRNCAKHLMHDIERGGIEIVNIIFDNRENSKIIPISDAADMKRSNA